MQKLLLQVAFFLLIAHALQGQTAIVSDPLFIRSDYGYELIGRIQDHVLVFRDRFDNFTVQAFDNQMHLSWSKDLVECKYWGWCLAGMIFRSYFNCVAGAIPFCASISTMRVPT